MSVANKLLQAAAGNAGEAVYVDDLFSTFLYQGTSSNQDIVNGLDLSGEGGLVWVKGRPHAGYSHNLYDTARGVTKRLASNETASESTYANSVTAFNNNGFSLGSDGNGEANYSGSTYVSWSFRKAEKFFDIVTYTGDGTTGRQIAHNLGSSPGMMFFKKTNGTGDWKVFHRSLSGSGLNGRLRLDSDGAEVALTNNFFVSSTYFGSDYYNASGDEWVVYLFAHDEQEFGEDSDEAIIHCGSYTGTGSDLSINLGFEPQWILFKKSNGTTDWVIRDNMRGTSDSFRSELYPNLSDAEYNHASGTVAFTPTGFRLPIQNGYYNTNGDTFIYMAIARPHKPASEFAATDVFKPQVLSAGEGSDTFISTGFPVDAVLYTKRTSNATNVLGTRLTGGQKTGGDLKTDSNDAEGTNSGAFFLDHNNGVTVDFAGGHFNVAPAATDTDYARYYFRRMRGFFDIVTYTSNTTYPNTFAHNLGVVPELVIVKARDRTGGWTVYAAPSGNNRHLTLNSTAAESSAGSTYWNSTTPTDSVVHVGGQDETWGYNGYKYIALLFASASGISKVGSYSGTGSSQNIDCGFSNGARFVLIKNKNNAGGWYFWDSERGITTNNDPFLRLGANDGDQNYTGDDIDPHSSGFNVSSNNNAVNKSGRDYLFLAIA